MTKVREFANTWDRDLPFTWTERDSSDLMGSSEGGHLFIPCFRPFDFLAAPNQALPFFASVSSRLAVDAPRGVEPFFHRNVDFDTLYFQWAGETKYETEFGPFTAKPAELMLVPGGVAHSWAASADALRLIVHLRDPLEVLVNADNHIGETDYRVTWVGGPDWAMPPAPPASETVVESLHTWADKPGDKTLVKRRRAGLTGSTGGRAVQKIRLFDIFTEVTGRKGPGPVSMRNDSFFVECYNTDGAQFAFHRGNGNDEFQFQFCGTADNICEFGTDKMGPGDLVMVRRGIAHRVIGSRNFRRIVFYGREQWDLLIDPKKPLRRTRFDVAETVVNEAPWRKELVPA
jgi:hypothetical protein